MKKEDLTGILKFIRNSEQLKDTLRSSHTSKGRIESVAEHSWRLCLMVLVFEKYFPDVEISRVLKMCIIHDLGEAINGDIPAPSQIETKDKSVNERNDFLQLGEYLPADLKKELVELWDEYENASSAEAKIAKALDKLETIIQHNQGQNPEDFNYAFNLDYGREYTSIHPVLTSIRMILDDETRVNVANSLKKN